jgi:hypothetical protein
LKCFKTASLLFQSYVYANIGPGYLAVSVAVFIRAHSKRISTDEKYTGKWNDGWCLQDLPLPKDTGLLPAICGFFRTCLSRFQIHLIDCLIIVIAKKWWFIQRYENGHQEKSLQRRFFTRRLS